MNFISSLFLLWTTSFFLFPSLIASASSYNFNVGYQSIVRLGVSRTIVTVNGQFPGPTITVREGDQVLITVTNNVEYNLTMHWHGVRQFRTGWSDGPAYITQCPLQQGQSFLYNFTIQGQRGTLWWHAHITWLRATVHGALIILPKSGIYPFQTPAMEVPIILGEWYNANVEDIYAQALSTGGTPNISDAFTLNGLPGPLIDSTDPGFQLHVEKGKTYLLRLVNAAMTNELFFGIAGHQLKVVAMDGVYIKRYTTDFIVMTPGQTSDVLLKATSKTGGVFNMAARAYISSSRFGRLLFDGTTAAGIVMYSQNQNLPPQAVVFPPYNATDFVTNFTTNLRSLGPVDVPLTIDRNLFMTISLSTLPCGLINASCAGLQGARSAASMNNISFARPLSTSLLQAYYENLSGVYTEDFPDSPDFPYDYTGNGSPSLWPTVQGTRLSNIPYGSNVQIVFQNTALVDFENHPMHLHGYNFFVVGEGFGNFDPAVDPLNFNLINPPQRNTVGVPTGGWAAIRFKADNPGVWLLHCHLENHSMVGLEVALVVHNGNGPAESLMPPPQNLVQC